MKTSRLLSAAAALLLAGCAVGPDYHRPAVSAPAFKEAGDWKPAQPADQAPRGPWWQAFGDATLNALEERCEVTSVTLQAAEAQYRAAQAAGAAASSGLFPSLGATGAADRTRTFSRSAGGVVSSLANSFAAGVTAAWEFDLWGHVRREAEAGRAQAAASAADLEGARLSLHALVAQTYFALRVTEAQQDLYRRLVADYGRFLQISQNRYTQGVDTRADVAAAEAQLKSAEAAAVDLGLQRAQLEHALAVALGQPPASFSLPVAPFTARPVAPPALLASEQLQRRPDIGAAERRLAAASAQVGVAVAGYFPLLSLTGTGGYQSPQSATLFNAPSRVWSAGAGATLPLFAGGRVRAQVAEARAAYDGALAAYRQTVLTAFQEVEDNLAAAAALEREAAVQAEAVAAARVSATIALNQYQAGVVSYLNVVTAQAAQLTAERTAVELLGRQLSASVGLLKAAGGDWHGSPAAP